MRKVLTLFFSLTVLSFVAAQSPEAPTGRYFGMGGGAVTGYGLMYRDWSSPVGWQVIGVPIAGNGFINVNAGLTALWLMNDAEWTRFFVYAGGMGTVNSSSFEGSSSTAWGGGVGGGIGLEVLLWHHIAIDIQGGYQARFDNGSLYLGPTAEVALSYRL